MSAPYHQQVTVLPSDAPHARCLLAVFNILRTANLPGLQ